MLILESDMMSLRCSWVHINGGLGYERNQLEAKKKKKEESSGQIEDYSGCVFHEEMRKAISGELFWEIKHCKKETFKKKRIT